MSIRAENARENARKNPRWKRALRTGATPQTAAPPASGKKAEAGAKLGRAKRAAVLPDESPSRTAAGGCRMIVGLIAGMIAGMIAGIVGAPRNEANPLASLNDRPSVVSGPALDIHPPA
jgi:hypothetical protein